MKGTVYSFLTAGCWLSLHMLILGSAFNIFWGLGDKGKLSEGTQEVLRRQKEGDHQKDGNHVQSPKTTHQRVDNHHFTIAWTKQNWIKRWHQTMRKIKSDNYAFIDSTWGDGGDCNHLNYLIMPPWHLQDFQGTRRSKAAWLRSE